MATIRRFSLEDLWSISRINIDQLTETFKTSFYMYSAYRNPQLAFTMVNNEQLPVGYIIGLDYNTPRFMMAQVVAVTVCPDYRRLGIASDLMRAFESGSEHCYMAHCTGLYVRASNEVAQNLYKKLGYQHYRVIKNYYSSNGEDGIEMRKPFSRDTERISVYTEKPVVHVSEMKEF